MLYLFLKTVHIISSTILFGTGIGSAFYMFRAYLTKDIPNMHFATKNVVLADFLFTTPAVIIQPITGIWLIYLVGYPFMSTWIMASLLLYFFIGLCWVPVVFIQIRLQQLLEDAMLNKTELPAEYHQLFKVWFILGWPAFIGVVIIFFLMVYKIN